MPLLASLLLGAAVTPHPGTSLQERLVEADVPRLMKAFGYPFEPVRKGSGCGTIDYQGARVQVGIATLSDPEDTKMPPRLVGIHLEIEIPVGEEVPLHEATRTFRGFIPTSDLQVIPHLGRTVTLLQDIAFQDGFDEFKVRSQIDAFWRDGGAYARQHRGSFSAVPERDWAKARFPDSLVVDRADRISFERAVDSWGLERVKRDHVLLPDHPIELWIGGKVVAVTPGHPVKSPVNREYGLRCMFSLPAGLDSRKWAAEESKQVTWARLVPHFGPMVFVETEIDMMRGVRLGDLRRAVLDFGAKVKQLQESTLPRD